MMGWFPGLQLVWTGLVCVMIAERAVVLFARLPTSAAGAAHLTRLLRAGQVERSVVWSDQRPGTLLSMLLARTLRPTPGSEDDLDPMLLLGELAERAGARLLWIRTAATLSSTFGLLGGVLSLAGGFGSQHGLLALQRGLAERVALDQALGSMAIGVGTAAFCFFALSRLRPQFRAVVAQGQTVAHLLVARNEAASAEKIVPGDLSSAPGRSA